MDKDKENEARKQILNGIVAAKKELDALPARELFETYVAGIVDIRMRVQRAKGDDADVMRDTIDSVATQLMLVYELIGRVIAYITDDESLGDIDTGKRHGKN